MFYQLHIKNMSHSPGKYLPRLTSLIDPDLKWGGEKEAELEEL